MNRSKAIVLCALIIFVITSCASFIKEGEEAQLKLYEKRIYVLKKDFKKEDHILKKDQKVNIYIKVADESIKVYCYPSNVEFLKSDRILILYLFQDNFENDIFDLTVFEEKLGDVVQPIK